MTTICALSDLHGELPSEMPDADILIIAGDISPLQIDQDINNSWQWLDNVFVPWARKFPYRYRLFIAGNHDFAIQAQLKYFQDYIDPEDIQFLHDKATVIEGHKFYGTPWVPNLKHWAFYGDRTLLKEKFAAIPNDTDVLIAHGPPYRVGMSDGTYEYDPNRGHYLDHVGCPELNVAITRVAPRHVICGHIHEGHGHYYYEFSENQHCDLWNVSILDEFYVPRHRPVVFEI